MATTIKGSQIRDETVTAADLGPDSVTNNELASTAISDQTEKDPAVNGDFVLISDSAGQGALKKVQVGNLGIGGGGDSDMIEDADHNTKIEVEANADENKIRFDTAGAERMIIDETGNVGIGTTDPGYNLHLASAASAVMLIDGADNTDAFLRFGQGGTLKSYIKHGSGGHLVITNETGDKDIIFNIKDNTISREGLRLNGNVAEVVVNEGSDSLVDFRVESDSQTHMLFVDGGNNQVGVGTDAPATTLHVKGDPGQFRVEDTTHDYAYTIDCDGNGIRTHFGDVTDGDGPGYKDAFMTFGAYDLINRLDTASRDFHIYGTNTTTGFYFDESAGNFGIGTITPSAKLEVNGEVLMSGGTLSTDSVDVGLDIGGHINLIRDVNNITDGAALGVIHFAGTEDAGSNFGEGAWIASYASEAWNVGSAEGANLRFYTQINGGNAGPDERMRIDNTGKVGIGVSAPQSLLHLEHTDTTTWPSNSPSDEEYSNFLLTLRNNTNTEDAFAGIAFDVSTETDADSIGAAIAAHCSNANSALHDTCLVFATNDAGDDGLTERMRITPDGKVGIGDVDPSELLHVGGNILLDGEITVNGNKITLGPNQEYLAVGGAGIITVAAHLVPSADNSKDLGAAGSGSWRDLHLEGDINFTGNSKIDSTGTLELECSGDMTLDSSGDIILETSTTGEVYFGSKSFGTSTNMASRIGSDTSYSMYSGGTTGMSAEFGNQWLYAKYYSAGNDDYLANGKYLIRVYDVTESDSMFRVRSNGSGGSYIQTSFTAGHDTSCEYHENLKPGMIIESTGEVFYDPEGSLKDALPRTRLATTNGSKTVFGIVDGELAKYDEGGALIVEDKDHNEPEFGPAYVVNGYWLEPAFKSFGRLGGVPEGQHHIATLGIGDSNVWITNINGNLEAGDLVESSEVAGYGRKQDDDIMRSKTVAKLTVTPDWDSIVDTIEYEGQTYKKCLAVAILYCG